MKPRLADPYRDTDVIDANAPRFNQAVIGSLTLLAFVTWQPWILGLLALQLAVGLTLGRRFCLPCVLYFEVVQSRVGEGPIEDARPPRFANMVGVAFLGSAAVALYAGAATVGWVLGLTVAVLALLAASTGICAGCEFYKLAARLRGVSAKHVERIDPEDVSLNGNGGIVQFSHPLCSECREWEGRLAGEDRDVATVDVSRRPELARKYGIVYVPTVVSVAADGRVLQRLAP